MRRKQSLAWWLGVSLASASTLVALVHFDAVAWAGTPRAVGAMTLRLEEPGFVLLLAALPFLVLSARSSLTGLAPGQRLLSLLLRAALLTCLVLAAARPVSVEQSSRVCRVVLVDVSNSVGEAALDRASAAVGTLLASDAGATAGDSRSSDLQVIAFGDDAQVVTLKVDAQRHLIAPSTQELRAAARGTETNLEAALRLARAVVSRDCVQRYLVMTDGIETMGQAATVIAETRRKGARLSILPLTDRPEADVAITALEVDREVEVGEPFQVRVTVRATRPTQGTLRLLQGGEENGLGGSKAQTLSAGDHTISFESVARVKGEVIYTAEWQPNGPDQFPANNRFEINVDVPGPPRVLIVDREPGQATHLARALVAQQFDVDVRAPSAFPGSKAELGDFSFVIVSDVSRKDISRGSETLLLNYVRQGGGLLFAGGEASYGPGGWQGSPLAAALPVHLDSEKTREVPGVAMSLVIDRSGSMTGLPLQMAKEACIATLSVLSGNDLIEVIAFDSKPSRFVPLQKARYRSRIESALITMQPGGGTEIFSSLDMAYQDLASIAARKKHIILLTDGNASSDGLYELAVAAFAEGISITTVGLGGGTNAELLAMIAEAGGGRFHAVDDPSHLPRIFTRETELIAQETAITDWVPVTPVARPQFLAGVPLATTPYLRGFTRTQMRAAPSELILRTDTGEPVLARRRHGLGWIVAWTSDLKARWAVDWLRWSPFPRFLAQLVRAHQLTDNTRVIPLEVTPLGETVEARFDAFDDQEGFDSELVSELLIKPKTNAADANQDPITVPFERVAPGRYLARVALPGFGSYALLATHRRASTSGELIPVAISRGSVSRPYPEEYRELTPQPEVMKTWAEVGGGFYGPLVEAAEAAFRAGEDRVISEKGRHPALIFLSLVLFLLDLFVRRVRLIDRNFHAATRKALSR